VFKANPIKKYKPIQGTITDKALTIPIAPKLHTSSRATLKEELHMNID
jgi:hypothetical protein